MNLGFSQQEIKGTLAELNLPEHSYYMRRAARALDIVNQDKVHALSDDVFRVDSQWDDKHYHVELNHGNPGCTCPDHQKNTGATCKHMIASMLYAQKQAQEAITIIKTTDGNEGDYWRQSWLIAQGTRRIVVYEERDRRLFCTCGASYGDCKHKQLVIKTVTKELKVANECGSKEAKALQDKMNEKLHGQHSDSRNNGNGAKQAPSQQPQLDLSNPFQQSEQLDIDQIEGRSNGELVHKLSNGKFVISYKGIMKLSEKHHITFETAKHSETSTVIAQGRCGRNERVSGKPINGNANTAIELAKRNAARQLLPLGEIKAMEKKAQLEATFDWQKAKTKCVELVTDFNLDIIIHELVQDNKLRMDSLSGYSRTEWLVIHKACQEDATNNDGGDNSPPSPTLDPKSVNNWSYNSPEFISKCRDAIQKVRDDKVEANEMPLQKPEGKRKLQMDSKLRTFLIETDLTSKAISCREICEEFEGSIVTRLRAGIDSGADISTVELD